MRPAFVTSLLILGALGALTPWTLDLAGATPDQACDRLQTLWDTIAREGH